LLPKVRYQKPKTVDEAVSLLSERGREAKIFAGGTDLLIGIEEGTVSAQYIVDVKGIADLHRIRVLESGGLAIGACVTINEILETESLPAGMDAIREAASVLGTYQIRNRATVGGNLCNASPACDLGPPLLVLGASLKVVSAKGKRTVPLRDFFSGVKLTCCEPDELVTHIVLPGSNGTFSAFRKRQRIGGHDLALVNAAAAFSIASGLRIALGAVAPTPLLVDGFDGTGPDEVERIIKKVMEAISPVDDVRSSRLYRERMAEFLVVELLSVLEERRAGG
jgi:CO/xanthine dehydrogenase FAD-binding subunit